MVKRKTAFIVSTPSGRSIISRKEDPNKALHNTKKSALETLKQTQKMFNVKLNVRKIVVSKRNLEFV